MRADTQNEGAQWIIFSLFCGIYEIGKTNLEFKAKLKDSNQNDSLALKFFTFFVTVSPRFSVSGISIFWCL